VNTLAFSLKVKFEIPDFLAYREFGISATVVFIGSPFFASLLEELP
jgi:hypothetical protein